MIESRSGRCVVVDVDDTLFDERAYVRSGFRAAAAVVRSRFGIDCHPVLDRRAATGALEGAFQAAIARHDLPESALELMVEAYRSHEPEIQPRPGVRETLALVHRMDGVVGCITDGAGARQRRKIAALGLSDVLQPVLISGETGHAKPDPANFRTMMELVRARSYWYVADNPAKDFVAPNGLGWTTVGILAPDPVHNQLGVAVPHGHSPQRWLALPEVLALLAGGTGVG